jgi:hypothetical protein
VFVEGRPPPELLAGGSEPNSGGAWWRFKALSQEVARDPGGRAGVVRERWSGLESAWRDEAAELAARLPNSSSERGAMLGDFMQSAWAQASAELEKLTSQFAGLK